MLENSTITFYDNKQAIRAITSEQPRLRTAMKHRDVAQMWVRQEYKQGKIDTKYTPASDMPADGCIKTLTPQQHDKFIEQLNLKDIYRLINIHVNDMSERADAH